MLLICNSEEMCDSLFVISLRKTLLLPPHNLAKLPQYLQKIISKLKNCIQSFRLSLQGLDVAETLLNGCLAIDLTSNLMHVEDTIMAMENHLSKIDFFDLCSRFALDEVF